LAKAHALYEQQHRHTRALSTQLVNLRDELVQTHQQAQQHALGALMPKAPIYSSDPDASPLAFEVASSADAALLALLDNSAALSNALSEKQTLVERMRAAMETMEAFVHEQLQRENQRKEEEQKARAQRSDPALLSSRRELALAGSDDATSFASAGQKLLPDVMSTLTSPLVSSLTSHIAALQEQNSLTQALLLLKNKALAQQQEQSSVLAESLRAQITSLTAQSARREREHAEERSMLTEGLKTIIDTLARENEQLKRNSSSPSSASPSSSAALVAEGTGMRSAGADRAADGPGRSQQQPERLLHQQLQQSNGVSHGGLPAPTPSSLLLPPSPSPSPSSSPSLSARPQHSPAGSLPSAALRPASPIPLHSSSALRAPPMPPAASAPPNGVLAAPFAPMMAFAPLPSPGSAPGLPAPIPSGGAVALVKPPHSLLASVGLPPPPLRPSFLPPPPGSS
jgi:hypothetical protein